MHINATGSCGMHLNIALLHVRPGSRPDIPRCAPVLTPPTTGPRDKVLKELLAWFKADFFTWVDTLPCSTCGGKTTAAGGAAPSQEDTRFGAGRVELHQCATHQAHAATRFPRYNDPVKLLETRRGPVINPPLATNNLLEDTDRLQGGGDAIHQ